MKYVFFLQTPPGLETLAETELKLKYHSLFPLDNVPVCHLEKGGLTIELERAKGLSLNYWLKIPNRILLRFAHFKCRDLPKLFNKVKKLEWSDYYSGQNLNINVSSVKSRLFDDRKIEKTLNDGLSEYLKRQPPRKKSVERVAAYSSWNLFCRFEEDWCTLSIDTSGERLGLRGNKPGIGLAPLRENLAAALYLFTLQCRDQRTNSRQDQTLSLLDPFAGSGTIIQESSFFFEPSIWRNYAFEFYPIAGSPQKIPPRPSALQLNIPIKTLGVEKNENQYDCLFKNHKEMNLAPPGHQIVQGDTLERSFLSEHLNKEFLERENWIITNPPYGKRLRSAGSLEDLLHYFFSLNNWDIVGFLLPTQSYKQCEGYDCIGKLEFSNGGEQVVYSVWSKQT